MKIKAHNKLIGAKIIHVPTLVVYTIVYFRHWINGDISRVYLSNGENYTDYILNPESNWRLLVEDNQGYSRLNGEQRLDNDKENS